MLRRCAENWIVHYSQENEKKMAKTENSPMNPAVSEAVPSQPQQAQPVQVNVDDSHTTACYANFCRVTGSPEELIVDFGLNPQPVGVPKDPIQVTQRVILNFYTAKRLLAALQMSIQRHEAVFGVLETDIQKRLRVQQPS
jgi:hypothetical protein